MVERDGKFYQRRSEVGFDGQESNVVEEQIDYVIGSGNHARSYLHRGLDGGGPKTGSYECPKGRRCRCASVWSRRIYHPREFQLVSDGPFPSSRAKLL
jgi:hypothetical protein